MVEPGVDLPTEARHHSRQGLTATTSVQGPSAQRRRTALCRGAPIMHDGDLAETTIDRVLERGVHLGAARPLKPR